MADDVLSQSEIDKLLSALSDGTVSAEEVKADEEQKKVKTYDFKRPDKFSKDQIRTLFMLHESFSRLLNTYLSTHLRTLVNVEVASVEQLTYQEFVQSLANPSVISILAVPPLKGNIIMEVNTEIAFAFIDRVFGGEGRSGIKPRVLTEIEEVVMKRFIDTAMSHLKEAWSNVIEFKPSLEATESNPQFTQIVPPSDMVVIVTIQMKVGDVEGMMNICIPYLVLEPIMSKLTTTFWVASSVSKDDDPEQVKILQRKIERTKVPFVVQLGGVDITINEFLTLGFGDVLQMDAKVDDNLLCLVGHKPKFYCRPGTSGKKMAVQITKIINEGDEDTDE
ncbi:flagellar motor switch protein FliM [Selenomonas ruminantium]|uniref:Flagellar motor switch protein FliM n=1 Tax=Selenomonas ruminantium TaxID=971 RepID=A0A1I3F510_SELRU|nr:flagellar motor switch protein FliM [Selenomonas ruminantium]MBE6073335.1 flagellar motor switch protein FliM [Selenomonas ruminantium]SFI06263.1 flagellar motor switch protein FliM [Selenomonas ruminantium]